MSDKLIASLQKEYGYSNYDIARIKYVLVSITSEFSKFIILGIFFGMTDHFISFLLSTLLLLFLRTNVGGLHCKHYSTCFLLTFAISYLSITFLPSVCTISYFFVTLFSISCMLVNYYIGPIASPFRPLPESAVLKRCRNMGCIVIVIYIFFASIFQNSVIMIPYIQAGFWTIILHTFQLVVAKFLKIGGEYE